MISKIVLITLGCLVLLFLIGTVVGKCLKHIHRYYTKVEDGKNSFNIGSDKNLS